MSLGTADRLQARDRGAALTATSARVVEMLNRNAQARTDITERELQAIAKAMYEERLTQLCTEQRATPYHANLHSAVNTAFVDYFERLTRLGGHTSFLPSERDRLEREGWSEQRIADLATIINLREQNGLSPIRSNEIDQQLAAAGFAIDDKLRWMVELALYPVYRDAYAAAENQLQGQIARIGVSVASELPTSAAPQKPEASPESGEQIAWGSLTPSQVAARMIKEVPRLFEHRQAGKRAAGVVGEQTLRQIRWAAALLEKSLPAGKPLAEVTRSDILELDRLFDQIPTHFGKSASQREAGCSLRAAAAEAAAMIAADQLPVEEVGLSTSTANKHYNKLGQIHKFLRDKIKDLSVIDFTEFTAKIDANEREARLRYTLEQGEAIFSLPPWTGCKDIDDRLASGSAIFHDGLFFVLLLVWYTGARREELCKLMLDDVEERHGMHYLLIRPTETGRIKNESARRVVVIADELIRLGLLRYVDAMRAAGERLLFPELLPGGDKPNRKLGDVFYKLWWIYIKPMIPDLKRGQAMHAARHMVSDELKDQEVFIEFRNDHLGHKGTGGEGVTRYPSPASLQRLSGVVAKIPIVTAHLPDQNDVKLLPTMRRKPRPTRAAKQSTEVAE